MHEMSIAEALLEQVNEHTPPGAAVEAVHVRIGPLRAVEPDALQLAWQMVTEQTACANATLRLDMLPWQLRCSDCRRQWDSDRPYGACVCGCALPDPAGSDELALLSLDVREPAGVAT